MQPYKAKRTTRLMTTKPNKPVTRGLRPSYAEDDSVSFTTATSSLLSSSEDEGQESINDEVDEEIEDEEDESDESDYSGCSGARKVLGRSNTQPKKRKGSSSSRQAPAAVRPTKRRSTSRNNDPSPEAATLKVPAPASKHLISSRALAIMDELALKLAHPNSSQPSKPHSSLRSKIGPHLLPSCIPTIQHDAFSFDPSSAPLLGKGNFGSVHEGLYLGRKVAVKVQPLDDDDPDDFDELSTEALFGACLSHPGLLRTFAAQFMNREIVIISEVMSQGSVLQAFNGKTLASSANLLLALSVAEQVAWALHYLHSLDLVHLDVKGANVLIDGSMREGGVRAALCDFGLMMRVKDIKQQRRRSSHSSSSSSTMNVKDRGTLRYMGPEYFDESLNGSIGPASDIYALGCVLFEMANGGRAFLSDRNDAAVIKLRGKGEMPWSSGGSPMLESFLKLSAQCRSAKPSSRPDAKTIALTLKSIAAKIR